jgi:hypothetical protein
MNEISGFETEGEYLVTARRLQERVDAGELDELAPDLGHPFVYRRFLEKSSCDVWVLAVPDQAFRGYLKRDGTAGSLTSQLPPRI